MSFFGLFKLLFYYVKDSNPCKMQYMSMGDRDISLIETLELALYIHIIMQNFSSSKVLFEYNSSIYI